MQNKIKSLHQVVPLIEEERRNGYRVVHCHGVFDLLHPGHVRHLQEAKRQGDKLVVSITPDQFVNKGPGRPAFQQQLRLEQIASLECVDYVVLNDSPDAVSIIQKIKPSIYVKGKEYQEHAAEVTGKIAEEARAVEEVGGKIYYTDDIVFSSSSLINRYLDSDIERLRPFLNQLKAEWSLEEVLQKIEALKDLNVVIVGDAIIDEYQYVQPLGQSGKGVHMAARCLEKEVFLGGSLIIANHIAEFAKEVTLVTAVGSQCTHLPFIYSHLKKNVKLHFVPFEHLPTLTKRRYVLKDGNSITKLFETYSSNELLLNTEQTEKAVQAINSCSREADLVLVCDFGNGFINPRLVDVLSNTSSFLALNTQTNSGNRGFNVVTHYYKADFISLNEPELRLAAQDRYSQLEMVTRDIAQLLQCSEISVTRGVQGVYYYTETGPSVTIPALTMHAIDRVGAGDCYFALAAMCAAKKYAPILSGFLGSVAAAMDVQIVGNRESIQKVGLCKYVTRLLK